MVETASTEYSFGEVAKMEADLAASQEGNRIMRNYLDMALERMDYLEGLVIELGGSDRL